MDLLGILIIIRSDVNVAEKMCIIVHPAVKYYIIIYHCILGNE